MTFPWGLIFQLIEHRRLCSALPAEEVACGLDGCFGLSEAAWKRISAAWEGDRLACAVGSGDFPFDPRADRGVMMANQAGGERSTSARGDAER